MRKLNRKIGKPGWGFLPGLLAFALITLILSNEMALGVAKYEVPGDKRASEVLPPNLRSGPHSRVQDRVAADGYMLRFSGEFRLRNLPGYR
jgi:TM2 domain-containing membrane protein YozV